jgi:hypothetical protein
MVLFALAVIPVGALVFLALSFITGGQEGLLSGLFLVGASVAGIGFALSYLKDDRGLAIKLMAGGGVVAVPSLAINLLSG